MTTSQYDPTLHIVSSVCSAIHWLNTVELLYVPKMFCYIHITSMMQSKGEAAFKIYRAWLQDCRNEWNKRVIAHAGQITPRQWIVKIRSTKVDGEYIYPPDAGTTDPGYWHKDPGTGEYTLRAKGFRSCSLNLTTYLFTSQESYSHLHDLDSESSTSSREGAALPTTTQEPNCLSCWAYTQHTKATTRI
jgi:hypothetical protein